MYRFRGDGFTQIKAIGLRLFVILMVSGFLGSTEAMANGETKQQSGRLILLDAPLTYIVNEQMDILPDSKRQWSLEDIKTKEIQSQIQPANGKSAFGYGSSSYWIRLHLENNSSSDKWEISLLNPLMDKIEVFAPSAQGTISLLDMNRQYPTYAINLPRGQTVALYIHCQKWGSMIVPLRLTEQSTLL